jgi:hypothetical protein
MGIEPTIYRTRDEHANDYTTDGGQPTIYRTRDEHANDYTTDGGVKPTIYRTRDEHANDYIADGGSNPQSTTLETSTLTITPPMGGQTHDLLHSRRAR